MSCISPQKRSVCSALMRGGWALFFSLIFLFSACSTTTSPSPPPLRGHLLIVGSTALQPLTTLAATWFDQAHAQAHIDVRGGGSLLGLSAVASRQADIGDSDVYADPVLYANPDMTDHIICIVPFTMIVNPDVPLSSLSQQQLLAIFSTGKIRNWQELGGPNLPIVPVIRADTSGTRVSFSRYVLKGAPLLPGLQSASSSQAMVALVAHHPGAIGYSGLATLTPQVHSVAINGVQATPGAIAAGTYSFWGYEHMYTLNDNQNPLVAAFLSYMFTGSIQNVAGKMGYIPLTQIQFSTQTPSS